MQLYLVARVACQGYYAAKITSSLGELTQLGQGFNQLNGKQRESLFVFHN